MIFHCLFEQSGTFKNVFKSYGHSSFDYDILDDYGETDFKIDLFKEIDTEFKNIVSVDDKYHKTIFSDMKPDKDFIIAFFPCTHFCDQNSLQYRLYTGGKGKLDLDRRAAERLIARNKERAWFFEIYIKFCFICTELKIPTIIENPASQPANYLEMFSPVDISYREKDRTLYGDYFRKPTNYFAIGYEMRETLQMHYDKNYDPKVVRSVDRGGDYMTARSQLTQTYAKNFYKRFLERFIENVSSTHNDKTSSRANNTEWSY